VTVTPARPVPGWARWWFWLAWGLLVAAPPRGPARAESPVPALLGPLNLVGYPARTMPPQFRGGTVDAGDLSTTDLRGKVVLVNFWASWCLECRSEMPALERLHREFARRGLVVVGVNARESTEAVGRYAATLGLTFPLVLDGEGKIGALYGVVGLPATFLVARDGRAVAYAIGPRAWGSTPARTLIEALLAESPSLPKAP